MAGTTDSPAFTAPRDAREDRARALCFGALAALVDATPGEWNPRLPLW
jgi:hypothetical protein